MKLLIVFFAIFISSMSYAGTQSGQVGYIIVRASDGLVYFTLKGGQKNQSPECATINYWIIKDENSLAGQQQYSLVLTAFASGKTINVHGSNTCTRWGDGEDVNWIQMVD